MIDSVVGVTIWTDNLERLVSFYRDILGLKMHRDHGDFVNFVFGPMRLNLGQHDRVTGGTADPFRTMVHYGVDDIHADCTRLAGLGVEFIRSPEQEDWGGWVATLLDPDGNVLQLLQGAT